MQPAPPIRHIIGQPGTIPSVRQASRSLPGKVALVAVGSLFVALCAHLSFPLPFTPVPVTLSDFAVLLVGLLLGPELAFAALALYLADGAAGAPVFSPSGPGGVAQLLGVTGGYLFAYPFAAASAGFLVRNLRALPRFASALLACLAASTLIMASGAGWLGIFLHHDASLTFRLAVAPFIPGQMVKIVSAAGIYAALSKCRVA